MLQVYCQLRPSNEDPDETIVRFILPITTDDSVSDVKVKWGDIYPKIRRSLAVAKADPETAMNLPEHMPPSLGLQFSIKNELIDDPDVDIFRFLSPQIRMMVAGSIAEREQQKHEAGGIWTPSS